MCTDLQLEENVALGSLTTFEVGGPARWLARCGSLAELERALGWARRRGVASFVLGGGSNVLVADGGFDGLVIAYEDTALELRRAGDSVWLRAGAGYGWDALVERAVGENLAGIECLSGIPGLVGAAPIQNIGAYGQELAGSLAAVEVVDRESGDRRRLAAADCGLAYRHSYFKTRWRDRFVVVAVELRLLPGGRPTVRYGDLVQRLADPETASLAEVRQAVLEVRASKSMVLDAEDPNRRSAGSFFVNPVVSADQAEELRGRCGEGLPTYPAPRGVKLSAAWLIERAGFRRGEARGRAGLSSRHVLALINRGGATAEEILALAGEIRREVWRRFGVTLQPEPVLLGFDRSIDQLLG